MKKILLFISAAALCIMFSMQVFAAGELVVDQAGLLYGNEAESVESVLSENKSKYGMDYVVVTTNGIGEKTLEAYADDFYDENGYSQDGGILLLVNMDTDNGGMNRRCIISTAGKGINCFSDYKIENIYDEITPYLSDGDYAGAFREFGYVTDSYSDEYFFPKQGLERVNWPSAILFAIVIGIVVGLIVAMSQKSRHKSVVRASNATNYAVPGSLNLTNSKDTFLYVNVTHVPIPRNTNSGSGSHTHISSGGFTHGGGGGGRSF